MGTGHYTEKKEGRGWEKKRKEEKKRKKKKQSRVNLSTLIHVIHCWKKIDISHKTQVHSNRHKYFFVKVHSILGLRLFMIDDNYFLALEDDLHSHHSAGLVLIA